MRHGFSTLQTHGPLPALTPTSLTRLTTTEKISPQRCKPAVTHARTGNPALLRDTAIELALSDYRSHLFIVKAFLAHRRFPKLMRLHEFHASVEQFTNLTAY